METQMIVMISASIAALVIAGYYAYQKYYSDDNPDDDDIENDPPPTAENSNEQYQEPEETKEAANLECQVSNEECSEVSQKESEIEAPPTQTWKDLKGNDLQISVVLTTSYCSKYFEDMATRATLAMMCLNRKCAQNHLEQSLNEWKRQGSHKQIFRIDTFSELNELHKQVVSEGYNQVLLEDECGLPCVVAVGPTICKKIRKLTADLEMVADTFDK